MRWVKIGDHVIETESHIADIQFIETFNDADQVSGSIALIRTTTNAFQWIDQEVRPLEIQVQVSDRKEFDELVMFITGSRFIASWEKRKEELQDGERQLFKILPES